MQRRGSHRTGASASRTLLPFGPDRLAQPHDLQFRGLRHGIWLHPEVSDHLRVWAHLYNRLGIVLQHLAAHGRTTVVKGCRDGNRGWRRSPLGGANGMQYYLWWTPRGSRVADGVVLPADAVLVRAVRHHDDHAPLEAGSLDDYLPLGAPDDLNEDIAGRPWTDAQVRFVEDERPVRLILGRPGSGKTTVLWKAVEARSGQRVLYLTWSSALTRHAEERFASFAPADVEVVARDFADVRRGGLRDRCPPGRPWPPAATKFDGAITRLGRDMAGPWKNRRDALHAELRAILFGRAIPGETGCVAERGIARLGDDAYRDLRGDHDGVGPKAARALLKVARFLPADGVRAVFPELVAATRAIGRLRDDELPEGFDDFDRIVVDELQDLTLLETAVVVELCRAIGRRRGRAPWLLMAGDAGQTVRPTGFDWGPLNDLLARRVGAPARFQLDEHLRCPSRIAEVVERASERYVDLEKQVPPHQAAAPGRRPARRCASRPRACLPSVRGGRAAGAPRRGGRRGGPLGTERAPVVGSGAICVTACSRRPRPRGWSTSRYAFSTRAACCRTCAARSRSTWSMPSSTSRPAGQRSIISG